MFPTMAQIAPSDEYTCRL